MRLEEINFTNFRNFRDFNLRLNPHFNLIIGKNGSGKTAILDGITKSVSVLLRTLKAGDPKNLKVEDIRIFRTLESVEQADFARIDASASIPDGHQPINWKISKPVKGRSRNDQYAVDLIDYAHWLNGQLKNEARTTTLELPLIAFYSTARLWITGRQDYHTTSESKSLDKKAALPSRYRGYKNSLQIGTNFREFLEWFRKKEIAAIQKKEESFQLECVRRVIVQNIPGCINVYYELDPDVGQSLMLQLKDGPPLRYSYLSDGYRNLLALFADLAWRCVTLNPHHRENANFETLGVALIDELDLHLHPNWQKQIIRSLKNTFPKIQFICTTHSPFIIQEAEEGELMRLEPDDKVSVMGATDFSLEDVAEYLQQQPDPAWSLKKQDMYQNAKRYFSLLQQLKPDESPDKLRKVREELDLLGKPYADNVAYIAFLEQKRLLAESALQP